jgi:hypothetical protein
MTPGPARFGWLLLGSLAVGALAFSTEWTILPWMPSTVDFVLINVALAAVWTGFVAVALLRYGKRGLWILVGAPLVMWWPLALALLQWACMHGAGC